MPPKLERPIQSMQDFDEIFDQYKAVVDKAGKAVMDDHGNPKQEYEETRYLFINGNDHAFVAILKIQAKDANLRTVKDALQMIPDKEIYPAADMDPPLNLSYVPDAVTIDYVLPAITSIDNPGSGETEVADSFLATVKAHQLIHDHPHPNILQVHGCIQNRRRIVSVAVKRYPGSPTFREKKGTRIEESDGRKWYNQLKSAVKHFHGLGYAHNDITSENVILVEENADRDAVLVSLEFCKPFGEKIALKPKADSKFSHGSCKQNDRDGLTAAKKVLLPGEAASGQSA